MTMVDTNSTPLSPQRAIGVLGVLMVVLTAGCGAADDSASGKGWAAEFAAASSESSSEFVRGVLADGVIEPQEMREARTGMVQCVRDAGVAVDSWGDDVQWGLTYAGEMTPEMLEVELGCDAEWLGPLSWLYQQVTLNPNNEDWDSLVAACFVRNQLAPEGFTGQDYRELEERGGTPAIIGESPGDLNDAIVAAEDAPAVERKLPSGVDLGEGLAWECRIDPRT